MNSTRLTKMILARHGARPDLRLFRNETAGAWVGKKVGQSGRDVTLRHARMIQAGLAPGSSDLIGIADDGRFIALEVKTGSGRPTKEQESFLALVASMGGIAGVVRSVGDVDTLLGPPPEDG